MVVSAERVSVCTSQGVPHFLSSENFVSRRPGLRQQLPPDTLAEEGRTPSPPAPGAGQAPGIQPGFDPWSGKIPHAVEQLSPCATTTEPVL